MDQRLRILQRQAQFDDSAKEKYCQELDRVFSDLPPNKEAVSVWIVVHCHESTAADDVTVFLTYIDAEAYAINRMLVVARNALNDTHPDDVTAVEIIEEHLTQMEQRLNQNNFEAIFGIFEALTAGEQWFEIEEKVIK